MVHAAEAAQQDGGGGELADALDRPQRAGRLRVAGGAEVVLADVEQPGDEVDEVAGLPLVVNDGVPVGDAERPQVGELGEGPELETVVADGATELLGDPALAGDGDGARRPLGEHGPDADLGDGEEPDLVQPAQRVHEPGVVGVVAGGLRVELGEVVGQAEVAVDLVEHLAATGVVDRAVGEQLVGDAVRAGRDVEDERLPVDGDGLGDGLVGHHLVTAAGAEVAQEADRGPQVEGLAGGEVPVVMDRTLRAI
ncbi:hypothetical protein [Kutzneria kofuensis]|uniref:hypothetical protein n=1 Tax=Kutzneria kofuensis TaxID=103725 RepID=UPI0031E540D6